jgi:hypothetical protein
MTRLRKVLPLLLLALVGIWTLANHHSPIRSQIAYAQATDCSFTYTFTGAATQTAVSNLSGQTPCVNWRLTLSTTASLSATVTFQTSPDNSTWTPVPNTVCSSTVQPPCILQGANPIIGQQGMAYMSAYGSYVRVVTSSSSGTGTGTIRVYGAKGASAASIPQGGAGGGSGTVTTVSFTGGLITVTTPTTTPAFTIAGTSGGIPYFSSASTWASTAALTQYGVLLGGGTGSAPTAIAADTVTTHALFATLGAPAFRALQTGDLPAGTGTVTSVGWTGGIVTVATATTTPAFTIAGTSGGIPYFSSASTWASSGVLTANGVVLGGGAGATPTVTAADSTTTHALFATAGAPAFRALASSDIPALAYVTSVGWTGGIVTVATPTTTPAFTIAGTSGGIPYFSSASTWASSGALTANGVVLGGGAGATPTVTAADSTTTHALFATAGAPAFRALASSDLPAGTGTVTSVGWTGGIVTVATGTTTPAFTIAGTSGGIPYFSSASTWASSGALTANGVVLGGGAGATPTVTAADSTTTHALFATAGAPAFRALASSDIPALAYVTSVGWTGGIVTVATATTTPAFTIAGTSGGIPYFSSASTWASSAALAANGVVLGGGAGATPTVTAADSTTTHALFATAGAPAFRALALTDLPSGTGEGTGTLNQIVKWSNTTGGLADSVIADIGTGITVTGSTTVSNGVVTIVQTGSIIPTVSAQSSLVLVRNPSAVYGNGISIIGGTAGAEIINFGSSVTEAIGQIKFDNTANTLYLQSNFLSIGSDFCGWALCVESGVGKNGTALFQDVTATTGATLVTITPGASQTAASTILSVGGVASFASINNTASSFLFNGKTCTIVATVVTCV